MDNTRPYIPEDNALRNQRCENLKSYGRVLFQGAVTAFASHETHQSVAKEVHLKA
jgi:hypothetical protein